MYLPLGFYETMKDTYPLIADALVETIFNHKMGNCNRYDEKNASWYLLLTVLLELLSMHCSNNNCFGFSRADHMYPMRNRDLLPLDS